MPYSIRRNLNGTYQVIVRDTGRVLAYRTAIPYKVIYAVEANKARQSNRKFPARIASRKVKRVAAERRRTTRKTTKRKTTKRKTTKRRTTTRRGRKTRKA